MAVRLFCTGLMAALLTVNAFAQTTDTAFSKEWAVIDSLIVKQDLTRSALDRTNLLYRRAGERKLPQQAVKALLYRYSLEQRITTDDPALGVKTLRAELTKTTDLSERSILHALLAKQLQQYFNNNRWSLYERTATKGNPPEDITVWSTADFSRAITRNYLQSLQHATLLQSQPVWSYDAIIIPGNRRAMRPTLYDLLAHDALDFFKSDIYTAQATDPFLLNDANALQPAEVFMRAKFDAKDSSAAWQALRLFQQLIVFHAKDADKNALIDADIERIQWVYQKAVFPNAAAMYKTALSDLTRKYPSVPATAYAWYSLALLEVTNAQGYSPFGDTTHRYAYNDALQIIREAKAIFGSSNPAQAEFTNLLNQINRKEIATQTEFVNIPGKPILASVRYRNTDTLYTRIVRINDINTVLSDNGSYDWQKALALPVGQIITEALPGAADHQQHNAYFRIDRLPAGSYAIVSSTGKDYRDQKDRLSVQLFHVSSISFLRDNGDIFVLNRQTGAPLSFVKVTAWRSRWSSSLRRQIRDTIGTRLTDPNGHVRFDLPNGNWAFSFAMRGDTLDLTRQDYYYAEANDISAADYEKRNSRVFFFTDRTIYRPGQEMFFKGIAVAKDRETGQSRVITGRTGEWLYLRDANYRLIDSVRFSLNEYGSFSGRFTLPTGAVTGMFYIVTKSFNASSVAFSVEEYKRPAFEVTLDKPKNTYRLNDSITVTGNALAYAGNRVDGAKVVYTVTRNKRFLEPYFLPRRYPSVANRQIAQGETRTDAKGKFSVPFKALADDIKDSLGNPLFDYTISVNVTDLNGETRSASKTISVGFSSLKLYLSAGSLAEKDSVQKLTIRTTNFSDVPEPATVSVSIFRLLAPQRMIRERLLPRPDQFILSRENFQQDFPTDEYDNEHDPAGWQKGSMVWDRTIQTGETDTILINPGALQVGNYLIEAVTKDRNGMAVRQKRYLQLFDKNDTAQPYPQSRFFYAVKSAAEPGETASFLSGIPADKTYIIRKTQRESKEEGYTYGYQNAGIKELRYNVTEKDRGGVIINEVFVYNNRVYNNLFPVNVPWSNKTLAVRYETYRNKTAPGSQEKWTVSVQGNKGEAVAAELLTVMYDASLDQFREHRWNVPGIWTNVYQRTFFTGASNFVAASVVWQNGLLETYVPIAYRQYDKLAANGYELWLNRLEKLAFDSTLPKGLRDKYNSELNALRENTAELLMDRIAYKTATPAAPPGARRSTKGDTVSFNAQPLANETSIRGSANGMPIAVLYVVDGEIVQGNPDLPPGSIVSMQVLKAAEATALYGSAAANGAVVITTTGTMPPVPVQVRKNLNETAFFFPQLHADSSGRYSFSFTMPEALTQWKWLSLAHTKDLAFGLNSAIITTQKQLMVQPNAPRFLREDDNMEFSSKIVNMSDKEIKGQATLELIDATTNTSVDGWFQNVFPSQYFTVAPGQSAAVKFPIQVPFSYSKPLTWRIVAKTADAGDGEENTLPVLTNRMLVTESLPLFLKGDTTQTFRFEKLLNNKSESLTQQGITVEYTSNPVWYAVQALPYLVEYPYECAEQTFNRFYATSLASFIMHKNPRLKEIMELWQKDSSALLSNLQKNEDLKQVLLQETPWVLQAGNETQQKKHLAQLFDLARLSSQSDAFIAKLRQMQLPEGSFSWFAGGYSDRYITNYIMTGIGKLKRLGALTPDLDARIRPITRAALAYLDSRIDDDYHQLVKNKADLSRQQVSGLQIDYLYMRSFFADQPQQAKEAADFYTAQALKFWTNFNSYYKAETGLISHRNGERGFAVNTILPALIENASTDTKQGMYWKNAFTGFWYQSPVEHQGMMIAFMSELNQDKKDRKLTGYIDDMKTWLLLNKQTNNWRTTIATADACYALLLNGSDWLNSERTVTIRLGNTTTISNNDKAEAGTGYFKKKIDGRLVNNQMGEISVSVNTQGKENTHTSATPSWGSVYWQYFEDLDRITPAASPLSVVKKLFIEKNTDKGKVLQPIRENEELKIGDRIIARLEIRSDRDMDYVHLKDMRAASMEPVNVLSGYKWQAGLGYYESTRDASTNFFFSRLNKGTYVFEYPMFVTHTGLFSAGIATIQCMYAPEFTGHSEGVKVRVE